MKQSPQLEALFAAQEPRPQVGGKLGALLAKLATCTTIAQCDALAPDYRALETQTDKDIAKQHIGARKLALTNSAVAK